MSVPKNPLMTLIAALSLALSACSHVRNSSEGPDTTALVDSGIELSYGLGHTHRKMILACKDSQITGQTYLDRQILREGNIDASRYISFFQKTSEFMNKSQRNLASDTSICRSPFTLTVRIKGESKVLKGCRTSEEGSLGRLIRDGEYLLYWKK